MQTPVLSSQDIGRVVRAVRRHSQLRLEDLASSTGVSKQFLTSLEKGKPTLRLGLALQMLAELGVKVSLDIPQAVLAELEKLKAQEKASPGKSPRLSSRGSTAHPGKSPSPRRPPAKKPAATPAAGTGEPSAASASSAPDAPGPSPGTSPTNKESTRDA